MTDRRQAAGRSGVYMHIYLPAAGAIRQHGSVPVHAFAAERLQLFQRQHGYRQFDRTGGIMVFAGADMEVIVLKMGYVP